MYAGVNSLDNTRGLGGGGGLPALAQLRILSLPDNQIRRLDDVTGCIALQVVDLSQNYIDDLLSMTQALPFCLRALNIAHNPLNSISDVRHMCSLTHLMHLFVSACAFASVAADARIDLIPLFTALLPELVTVDKVNVSPLHRVQGKMLMGSLTLLHRMSNQQVIQLLSRGLASTTPASSSLAPPAALPFSDFADEGEEEAPGTGDAGEIFDAVAATSGAQLPVPSHAAASEFLHAPAPPLLPPKSVHALAHDLTRLKHKLASFASLAPLPPPPTIVAAAPPVSPLPLSTQHHAVTGIIKPSAAAPSLLSSAAAAAAVPSRAHHSCAHSASVISRAWRSSRARRLLKGGEGEQRGGVRIVSGAGVGKVGDNLSIKRLEMLEKTVAMQLQVIEKLHATLQRAFLFPVWRIVADAAAAATLIQSAWRGHIDREVVHVIRERKLHHARVANSIDGRAHSAAVAAAAATIAAFVRRQRAEHSADWVRTVIRYSLSSQSLHLLVRNMGDRMQQLEQRLLQLERSCSS
jgi:hypothetical protein